MYMDDLANDPIAPFWGYSAFTPTIPKLYWDVKSQEQRILNLFDLLDKLIDYCNTMGIQINANVEEIAKLREDFEGLKDGKFWDYYEQQITEWVNANMPDIIGKAVKLCWFGLTDDGYLCAYIPDSWSDISFDVGMVYGRSDYGRLILRMNVDGEGVIDNSYSYTLSSSPSDFKQLVADVELATKRGDSCFDTLFTNVSETLGKTGENV